MIITLKSLLQHFRNITESLSFIFLIMPSYNRFTVVKQHSLTKKKYVKVLNVHELYFKKTSYKVNNIHVSLNIFAYEWTSTLTHLWRFWSRWFCSPPSLIDDFHSFLPISIWSFSDSFCNRCDAISKNADRLNRIFSFESLTTFHRATDERIE